MSETNTPKTSVCGHLVKLHKKKFRLALGPIVSEVMQNKFFLLLASVPTRTMRRFFWSWYIFSTDLGSTCPYSRNKEEDTRVLQRLDSSHGKCSYPRPEECFYRQQCYLSASMQLFLPTLLLGLFFYFKSFLFQQKTKIGLIFWEVFFAI